jgi:outer membrane protein W
LTASAEYKRTEDHSIYGSYTYSPTTTAIGSGLNDSLIASRTFNKSEGWTVGQRLQLAQRWKLNTETQSLEDNASKGLVNSVGLEFAPKQNWTIGLSAQKGSLTNKTGNSTEIAGINEVKEIDRIDRQSVTLSGGYTDEKAEWSSKLEQRQDSPSLSTQDQTKQWLSTNRVSYKVSDDWKLLGKVNYSITNKTNSNLTGKVKEAKLVDSNVGFAYRPLAGKWNVLAKYGYFYDLAPTGQISSNGSEFDQESHIVSIEGNYQVNPKLELAAKVAQRQTAMRLERGTGEWFRNNATYAAAQARLKLPSWLNQNNEGNKAENNNDMWTGWGITAEYRMLKTEKDGVKKGALVGIDKDINANMRLGVGYNFTDFSADLTQLSYKTKGFYFNLIGRF